MKKLEPLDWEEIIQAQEESGMTHEQFCEVNQISIHALKYHRAKRKTNSLPGSFVLNDRINNNQEHLYFRMDFKIQDWFKLEIRLG
jgi:hypothetical protein